MPRQGYAALTERLRRQCPCGLTPEGGQYHGLSRQSFAHRAAFFKVEVHLSCKLQKKVEMLFAHLKRILGLGRLRLRGPCGARDEFLLAATAQNLRKLAKIAPNRTPKPA